MRGAAQLLFWSFFDVHEWRSDRHTEAWIGHRSGHWLTYTLPSILTQTESEWRYWLLCDPAGRALTEPLAGKVGDERVELVYMDELAQRLRALPVRDRYLLARIDSDDMYHPRVAENLLGRSVTTRFLQFNDGYAHDLSTGELREWRARSSPFYCEVVGPELRQRERWNAPNHTTVRPLATVLGPGHFLVLLHGQNTSTTIQMGGAPVAGSRKAGVLRQFGLA